MWRKSDGVSEFDVVQTANAAQIGSPLVCRHCDSPHLRKYEQHSKWSGIVFPPSFKSFAFALLYFVFCFVDTADCWWLCSSNKPAIIEIIFFLLHGKREVGCIWQTIDCKCECAQHVHLLCALCVVCLLRLRFSAENKFSADLIIIFSDIWQTHLSMIFELPHIHRLSIAWENYAQEISSDI